MAAGRVGEEMAPEALAVVETVVVVVASEGWVERSGAAVVCMAFPRAGLEAQLEGETSGTAMKVVGCLVVVARGVVEVAVGGMAAAVAALAELEARMVGLVAHLACRGVPSVA